MTTQRCSAKQGEGLQVRLSTTNELLSSGEVEKALFQLHRLAEDGVEGSYHELGYIYEYGGNGVEINLEKARHWYERSAFEASHTLGFNALGRWSLQGVGSESNPKLAFDLYSRSAKAGDHAAQYAVGWMYLRGEGTSLDEHSAREFFERSADNGNALALKAVALLDWRHGRRLRGVIKFIQSVVAIIWARICQRDRLRIF